MYDRRLVLDDGDADADEVLFLVVAVDDVGGVDTLGGEVELVVGVVMEDVAVGVSDAVVCAGPGASCSVLHPLTTTTARAAAASPLFARTFIANPFGTFHPTGFARVIWRGGRVANRFSMACCRWLSAYALALTATAGRIKGAATVTPAASAPPVATFAAAPAALPPAAAGLTGT